MYKIYKIFLSNSSSSKTSINHFIITFLCHPSSSSIFPQVSWIITSTKESLAMVIQYVNWWGEIVERFIEAILVYDTKALTLKDTLETLFSRHNISISRLRVQCSHIISDMNLGCCISKIIWVIQKIDIIEYHLK